MILSKITAWITMMSKKASIPTLNMLQMSLTNFPSLKTLDHLPVLEARHLHHPHTEAGPAVLTLAPHLS